MSRPFESLSKVITALAAAADQTGRTIDGLQRATGYSTVQTRRAVWHALKQGFVSKDTPCRYNGAYVYTLTTTGRQHRAARLGRGAPRHI